MPVAEHCFYCFCIINHVKLCQEILKQEPDTETRERMLLAMTRGTELIITYTNLCPAILFYPALRFGRRVPNGIIMIVIGVSLLLVLAVYKGTITPQMYSTVQVSQLMTNRGCMSRGHQKEKFLVVYRLNSEVNSS